MVRLLSPSFTLSTLLQLLLELSVLFVAAALIGTQYSGGLKSAVPSALVFSVVLVSLNAAFGIYRRAERLSSGPYVLRMFLAGSIGIPLAFAIDAALPGGGGIGDNAGPVIGAALGLLLLRHALVLPMVTALAPHRVLVLGTGREAHDVAASLAAAGAPGLSIVGFYPLAASDERFAPGMRVLGGGPLQDIVRERRVAEIIVAVREQRGGVLPLRALLDCRLAGVKVTDLARFYEQVHGRLPLGLVKVSWLIYANGYRQHVLRAAVKRVFDVVVASALLLVALLYYVKNHTLGLDLLILLETIRVVVLGEGAR